MVGGGAREEASWRSKRPRAPGGPWPSAAKPTRSSSYSVLSSWFSEESAWPRQAWVGTAGLTGRQVGLTGVVRGVPGTAEVHAGLEALMDPAARGGMTGCARGARPRGVTPAPFPKFAEFFRADGTVTRPGGGSDLILVPRTKCWVLGREERGAAGRWPDGRRRMAGARPSGRLH